MAEDIHVLCVDDEQDVLDVGKKLLEKQNEFFVDTVSSAPAALEILSRKTYDAIVADYKMEGMDGIELLKRVRDADKTVPFILFTGRGREEVVIEALNNGADFYLQKGGTSPTVYTELGHVIKKTVQMRRTQLTLAEQEERFHDILNTSDLIMSIEPDGRFLFVNRKWLDTLGYIDDEIRNLAIFDVIHEESAGYFRNIFRKLIFGENAGIIDMVLKTRSGKRIFVEGMASSRMVAGKCQYIRVIFRDVTARREAERGLIESEEKFSTVFNNSPYPIAIASTPDNIIMEVNRALLKTSGYNREEIIGKSPTEIGLYSMLDADMIHARMVQDGMIENIPMVMRAKGDEPVHVLLSAIPITIHDQPANVIMIAETTNLKRAEEELLLRNRILTAIEKELRANYEELLKREQDLSISERRFRRLFENLPVALVHGKIVYNRSGKPDDYIFLETNEAFSDMTGLVNVTGKLVTEVVPGIKDSSPELLEAFARVARTGKPERFEFNFQQLGIWNNVTVYSTEKDYFIAIFDDFTDRKRAEDALRASEQKYRTFVDSANEGIFIIQDGFIPFINPEGLAITGASAETLAKTPFTDFVHPDDRAYLEDRIRRRLNGELEDPFMNFRITDTKGEIHWLEVNSVVISWNDRQAILNFATDITDRKKSEEMLSLVMNGVPTFLTYVDMKNRRIVYANKPMAAFFGCQENGMVGMNVNDLLPDTVYSQIKPFIETVTGGKEITYEYTAADPDGREHIFEVTLVPQISGDQVTGIFAALNDITERRRSEAALQQVNKKLNLLSSITRHDINNKLLALDGYIELVQQKMLPDTPNEYLFSRISDTIGQIAAMIRFTKEYEKIGINAPVWQDLHELVNDAGKSAITIEVALDNDIPPGTEVFADPLISRVFFNLIENAIRHGGRITGIRFTTETRGSDRIIICEDDGDGIAGHLKEKIFERGFGKNTGFGLFISREILDITGMKIRETGEQGKGARFEITIPEKQVRDTKTRTP